MLSNLQFSTLVWIQFSNPFWQMCRSVIWTRLPSDKFCTFFPLETGLWVVGVSSGDMWQDLGATCPLTSPCLPGFPRAGSVPGSQHWSCPVLPPWELGERLISVISLSRMCHVPQLLAHLPEGATSPPCSLAHKAQQDFSTNIESHQVRVIM